MTSFILRISEMNNVESFQHDSDRDTVHPSIVGSSLDETFRAAINYVDIGSPLWEQRFRSVTEPLGKTDNFGKKTVAAVITDELLLELERIKTRDSWDEKRVNYTRRKLLRVLCDFVLPTTQLSTLKWQRLIKLGTGLCLAIICKAMTAYYYTQ